MSAILSHVWKTFVLLVDQLVKLFCGVFLIYDFNLSEIWLVVMFSNDFLYHTVCCSLYGQYLKSKRVYKLPESCLSFCSISMESLYVNVRGLVGKCREESLPEPGVSCWSCWRYNCYLCTHIFVSCLQSPIESAHSWS